MTEKGEWGFMRKSPVALAWLRRLFYDPEKVIICHNGKFELLMMLAEGIDVFDAMEKGARLEDTMIASKVLNSTEQDHDLEFCGARYLGRPTADKTEIIDWLKARNKPRDVKARGRKLNFSDVPDEIIKRRVLWDVKTTLLLWFFFKPKIAGVCPDLYETERMLVYVCADMENQGVRVDITRARELKAKAEADIAYISRDLDRLCMPLVVTKKKKGVLVQVEETGSFNTNSSLHKVAAFQKLGFELKYKTKPKKDKKSGTYKGGGNWAFDEYALLRYVSRPLASIIRDSGEDGWDAKKFYDEVYKAMAEHKLPERELLPPLMLKMNELLKMISTYYNHFIEEAVDREIGPDGREYGIIHCKFNAQEAMTGRFSSSEPNLQNLPRLLGPRECFVPRKGRHNWHLDYSQVEMRLFVHFAKDPKMAEAIDKDIHLYVATRIYKKPAEQVTKEQRKRAKGTSFGVLYGSGPATQAETLTKKGIPTTKMEASVVVASYHREFPSVKRLTNQYKVELIRHGYVENPFQRRYYIREKFAYTALNYMCQGTSADIIKAAMVKIWLFLRANGYRTKLIITVHDELVLEVPPIEAPVVIPQIMRIMENKTDYFVPITVEAEVVKTRWSEKIDPVKDLGFAWAA